VSAAGSFAAGARASLPVVLGYLSIGFAAGIVQKAAGLSEIGRASCRERVLTSV
jgi:predicted branched-subunit amino acid permease